MQVNLIEHTVNPMRVILTAARQCYSADDASQIFVNYRQDTARNKALLERLVRSGHHSVLEHVSYTFAIEGISRSCSHQLVRSRIASFSQQSQRYVQMAERPKWIVPPSIAANPDALGHFEHVMQEIEDYYGYLIADGIPPEDARFVLPNAAPTSLVMTMNFRELMHTCGVRLCSKAQHEIRAVFAAIVAEVRTRQNGDILADYLGPKCQHLGYCPEKNGCGVYPPK